MTSLTFKLLKFMIKIIIHLLFMLYSVNFLAQDYKQKYAILNKSDSLLYLEKDTISYLKKMGEIHENQFFSDELKLSKIYLSISDTANALEHLLLSYEKGGGLSINPEGFTDNHLRYLKEGYRERHMKYIENPNVSDEFICSIYELLGSDQLIRNLNMDSIVSNDHLRMIDSLNLLKLMNLVENYGFPMQKDYGSKFHLFYILMIHLPYLEENSYQKFLSFYKDNLLKGSISPELLAYFIERYEYSEEGQLYGAFANPWEGVGKIKDEKNLDKRRAELFLPRMSVWLAKRGIKE